MIDPAIIQKIARFSGISEKARALLHQQSSLREYRKGEAIFFEGDPCTHFYFVLRGEVTVFKALESGREMIMDIIRPGEAFGEVALINGDDFPANAVARTDAGVMLLARKEYLELLERFPEVSRSIIRDLNLRVRSLRHRLEVLGEAGVQSRIAQLLLTYAREMGREQDGGVLVPVHLSRNEVAGMVGARVETVIRIMSRWNKDNVVHSAPEGFLIPDLDALRELMSQDSSP
ncbi:MAG: Crp/Fnr family transcriptional regulator [Candidatus Lambdaproteobacteria bacterium]|nr:Crp/Fnr family transcriptional regulator [Candidatus Lambdaproteobacteria bacterium]